MTTQSLYFAMPAPPNSLAEQGPGTPSLPTNPIGQGIVVGTSSDASATLELRVVVNNAAQNIDTELSSQNVWTTQQIYVALDRLKWFIRQRGYILGSGGPGLNSSNNILPPI